MDWQRIRIQEQLVDEKGAGGRVPRTVECELTEDLVDLCVPGDIVSISGIVKMMSTSGEKGTASCVLLVLTVRRSRLKGREEPLLPLHRR
jgi:DNA helicase MCM8